MPFYTVQLDVTMPYITNPSKQTSFPKDKRNWHARSQTQKESPRDLSTQKSQKSPSLVRSVGKKLVLVHLVHN